MCCGVVPIVFGWFLSVLSLHALVLSVIEGFHCIAYFNATKFFTSLNLSSAYNIADILCMNCHC